MYIHTEPDFDRPGWFDKSRKQAAEVVPKWLKEIRKTYGAFDSIESGGHLQPIAIGSDSKYSAVGKYFAWAKKL